MKKILLLFVVCIVLVTSVQALNVVGRAIDTDLTYCISKNLEWDRAIFEFTNYENEPVLIQTWGIENGLPPGGEADPYRWNTILESGESTQLYVNYVVFPAGQPHIPSDGKVGSFNGIEFFTVHALDSDEWDGIAIPLHSEMVDCSSIPEYPSVLLPATFIIGFIGVVLLIQQGREQ